MRNYQKAPGGTLAEKEPPLLTRRVLRIRNRDREHTPVAVAVRYTVAPEREARFIAAMQEVRLSRLRTGAIAWRLYREGETAQVFIETYLVATWERELSDPKPSSKHWFPAEPSPSDAAG